MWRSVWRWSGGRSSSPAPWSCRWSAPWAECRLWGPTGASTGPERSPRYQRCSGTYSSAEEQLHSSLLWDSVWCSSLLPAVRRHIKHSDLFLFNLHLQPEEGFIYNLCVFFCGIVTWNIFLFYSWSSTTRIHIHQSGVRSFFQCSGSVPTWLLGLRLSSLHDEYMRSEKW